MYNLKQDLEELLYKAECYLNSLKDPSEFPPQDLFEYQYDTSFIFRENQELKISDTKKYIKDLQFIIDTLSQN